MKKTLESHQDSSAYTAAGVDVDAGNRMIDLIRPAVHSTIRSGADGSIGGFGGVFDLSKTGFIDPLLVAATDGVGTKVKIAAQTGIHDTIGIDLVAMCVNDLVVQGAEPLFFLDYYASGKLDPQLGARIVHGIADGCREAGCALIGGETAEMPGIYQKNDYDLAGFAVGAVERQKLLPRTDLMVGDVILGLTSSGLHSNGFSLVRYIVEKARLHWDDEAPFLPHQSLGKALLTPTRIYVKPLLSTLRLDAEIKALVHITGGGMQDNVPRVLTNEFEARIDLSRFPLLPVFQWLAREGQISQEDMLRTFNCGIGMIIILAAEQAQQVITQLNKAGETVIPLGILAKRTSHSQVVFTGVLAL